jgi:hypothetical protein
MAGESGQQPGEIPSVTKESAAPKLRISDKRWACIVAVPLLIIAMLVIFAGKPGGFEGQGVWFFALLPATLLEYPILFCVDNISPRASDTIFYALIPFFNFFWYWLLSYLYIRITRAID